MRKYLCLINLILLLILVSCNKTNQKTNDINDFSNIVTKKEMIDMNYFNFDNEINNGDTITTKYKGNDLVLINLKLYEGPLTLQLLPYGGIQSVFNYNLIIHFKNGYFYPEKLIYNNNEISVKEFIKTNTDLVNYILG